MGIKPKLQGVQALKNINFEVNKGEIFGIIGPDGAGKTTLFRILTTLILPDNVRVENFRPIPTIKIENYDVITDFQKIRDIAGYMPGKFSLYMDLTVEENLNFFATLFNTTIEENYHLIKEIYQQIEPFKDRKAGALSGGMKQKLALSCALIHKPKILFLDEPTTGVDPVSRKEFWEMLRRLKEQEITILVSTPYMDEASLCDRIALINKGEFISIDTPQNIIANFTEPLYSVEGDNMYQMLLALRKNPLVKSCFAFGDTVHVTVRGMRCEVCGDSEMVKDLPHTAHRTPHTVFEGRDSLYEIKNYLIQNGFNNIVIKQISPTIEDCYMNLAH
ncbi:MAG: ABC transporter ATP-binding protein [Bacteroidetes bacterium]|nr:ABC transporter ATP-binding protein [Bacteroidota bacterium]MCL2302686.1 ABC transporter ATP-binding protein [Lentimicrobiaceae bacterium]